MVISSGKKKWAIARFDVECETDYCPEILQFGIGDVTVNDRATPQDYEARDGKHEYETKCPTCGHKTVVGYALNERELIEDLADSS